MITSGPDHVGERIDCDVLIVGSGAGGGAAAWRLARAGLRVVCLEEGGHYTEADFSQDVGTAWRQLYAEDGQRLMSGSLFIPVAGGKALGGSTVVNSGICFRIPEWRFDEWHDEYGIDFRWEELLGKLLEAEEVIGVTRVNTAVWGGNNQFLEEARQTLGWSGGPMQRNAPNCVGCGACNSGCPSGAKLSVAKTYIPRAEKHGAGFVTHARAERAILEGTRITGVLAGALDPATEESVGTFEVRAKAVVLAGGAIQTPAFLLHNGLGNEHVGKHLHVPPGHRRHLQDGPEDPGLARDGASLLRRRVPAFGPLHPRVLLGHPRDLLPVLPLRHGRHERYAGFREDGGPRRRHRR